MRKNYAYLIMLLFQLTTILLSSNVYAADPDESLYNAAMSSITDGSYYITTNVKGVKFYVTTDGRLSNVKVDGGLFAISKSYGGQLYDIGILIDPGTGSHFTNTSLDENKAVLHPGFFYLTSSYNRNDWERQVFYMNKEGKFAIRSCNTAYDESGWNDAGRTFWNWEIDDTNPYILDVFPCYSYEPAYVWSLEGDGNGEEEPSGGISFAADDGKEGFDGEGVDKLFDGDTSTKWCTISDYSPIYAIFHSSAPIFVTGYKITTTYDSDWYPERNPKSWTLYGSTASSVPGKDDSSWEVIATVTNDTVLQAANFTTYTYSLPATTNKAYKNFKWVITAADDDSGMIQVSEFRLTYTTESGGETDDNITFADANVKALCVANWDTNGDGELSKAEAAAVTKLGKVFYANRNIRTFDELRYFISLNSIEEQAFFSCSNLTSVIIPVGVTSIEDNAFAYCNITSLSILGPVESIGSYAFFCCWNLASLTIPSSVTNVKLDAFAACDGLTSIVVDSGNPIYDSRNNCNAIVRTLDNTIVLGCKTTTIPTSVTTIGVSAFSSIPELFTIKIPDNIIKICEFAFSNCDSLKTVELGIGVVEIERWAFRECKSLKDFYCNATTPPATGDYVFGNNPKVNTTATLHVPSSALSTYKSTTPWSEFRNIVSMDEEPTEIDPLLVGVWKMYFGTNDYVLLTFTQDGKVRYQEYDGGFWQHDESYSFIYSNGTLKIIDNNGNEKGAIEVISLTSTTLELRNWPDRGVNTFAKQDGNGEEESSGEFLGAKRIFGDNLLKSSTYDDKTFTYYYDNKGFVTQIDRVKSSGSSKTYTIRYDDNITVSCAEDEALWVATLNSRGFVGSMLYQKSVGHIKRVTFTYNDNDQLTAVDYGDGDVFRLTYTDGNITRVTNYDEVIDYKYETSTQSKIHNVGNVMEFDNIFGVDLDDFALLYYMGALGKASKHLPLAGTVSGSTITGSWTTDYAGRAVQAAFNDHQFTWNWDDNGGEEPTDVDSLLVGVWKMYFGTNDYVLLTFSQDGKVRYQEYDSGFWQHDESYSFIYSNGTLKIIDNIGNEKGTIEVISLSSTTLELRNWPDRGVNTFTKQDDNGEEEPSGEFLGAKRVFDENLLKSATYNDKTFTYHYDNKGFVTQIDRVKSSGSSKTYTITYADNITVNCTDGARWTATLNSRGFVGAMEYTEDKGGVERVTFTYNDNDQLTAVDYGDGDVFRLTYTDGNITRVTNYDKVIDYKYETSKQSKILNVGNVMELDNIFGVDLDDFALLYYMGALGKATKHLPLAGTVSGSTITGSWTTDNAGRAVQATFSDNQFTWNWDDNGGEEPTDVDSLLVGVWKMYFGTNDYVLLTFSQDGKVRYQEYDGGVWQHDESYSFIYSNGTIKIIDNNGNEKGTIEVITLTSTTLELRNWPDRGVNTFTKQNGNEEESAIINGSIVGQWNMVSGSYKRYENDVLVSEENGNLPSPYHRIVFYDNGTLEFLEYSTSSNSYHEDGKGTYTIKDKKFVYGGGDWDKFVITSFDGADNMEVFFQFSEDKISTIVRKVYSVKLQRVSGGGDTPSQSDVEIDGIHYALNGSYAEVQSKKEKYRGEVIIPASVSYSGKTYSVTSIGDAAFYDCENLNSVVIPKSVRKIGNNAFYGCKLRNVLIKCQTPPTIVGTYLFSDQTFYHTTLYIPSGTWDVYAYDDVWYKFINIRESATSGNQLSDQQVYTMMDANTFAYSVYDPVNDCISSISSVVGIDENNPNHNWQLIDADGGHYLYNIGARKFVVRTRSIIGYALSDMPEPIEINDGDKGIILGNNKASQWVLVSNNRLNVDESVTDEVTGLIKLYSNQQADRNIYNLNGQRLSSPQKGLNIINGHKVLIK